jgi:ABC-type lipoprotein release transport system permease subunit
MRLLITHVWRSSLRMSFRLLAVSLVAAIGFAIFAGVYSAIDSLTAQRAREYEKGNMADLDVRFSPEDSLQLPDFRALDAVSQVEARLIYPARLALKEKEPLTSLFIALDPEQGGALNRLTLLRGKNLDPADPSGVVIDRNLSIYHGCDVGDEFDLTMADEVYHLKVVGVGLSPEFLIAPANPRVFVPAKGSLGVLFASRRLIEDRLGVPLVNSLLFKYREGIEPKQARKKIVDLASSRLTVDYSLPLAEQFGYRFLDLNLTAFKVFLPALIIVFDLTAFLVSFFLMFQWISQERQQIGAQMALGYSRKRIALAYFLPTLLISCGGIAFGLPIALFVAHDFARNFANSISFPLPEIHIDGAYVFWGGLGVLVVLTLASGWPQAWLLSLTPLEAVRDTGRGTDGHLGWLGRLLARISGPFWFRYGARNLLRNKAVSLMTIVAVALGLGVTVSFFITVSSSASSCLRATERDPWQAIVDFFAPITLEEAEKIKEDIPGISRVIPYAKGTAQLAGPKDQGAMYVVGLPPGSKGRNPEILDGRALEEGDKNTAIIERNLAARCGIQVGDQARFEILGKGFDAQVVGLLSGALPGETYVPLEFAQEMLAMEGSCSGFFAVMSGDPEKVQEELHSRDNISQVTLKTEIVSQILGTLGEILVILRIGAGFSIAVALLFIFCSVSFTVLQRKPEYVMLRILGFRNRTVAATIIAEVLFLGCFAALLAIPVAYEAASFLNARVSRAWFTVTVVTEAGDFLKILLPGLFLMPVAAIPALRVILRESLEKSLRERRYG